RPADRADPVDRGSRRPLRPRGARSRLAAAGCATTGPRPRHDGAAATRRIADRRDGSVLEDHVNEIDEYLRRNRDRYTREALTRQLREAGPAPAQMEAAGGGARGDPPVRQPTSAGPWATLAAVLLGLGYAVAIVAALLTTSAGGAISVLMVAYVVT